MIIFAHKINEKFSLQIMTKQLQVACKNSNNHSFW